MKRYGNFPTKNIKKNTCSVKKRTPNIFGAVEVLRGKQLHVVEIFLATKYKSI